MTETDFRPELRTIRTPRLILYGDIDKSAILESTSRPTHELIVASQLDMNIRFLAPCHSDATAEAKVIKVGKTQCPVAVEVGDAHQILVAVAQVTYMRLP